ncbi:hypothetical protein T459_19947 [Capsicum annuum]|uniref:Dehydrogenase E1 component domain-containing protein n=1 Tax=Capsicum annuum TaxID=4072 RepID=A0A2G2Z3J3_CAPAN|nr:hypothetical protein FXO37_32788 [Capsicum annuum]PHT76425.1 hypothetical protein T459_19947 [Capsicum annuum]
MICGREFDQKILRETSGVVEKDSVHQQSIGIGYGIRSIRVDDNDALVVFTVVQEARKITVNEHKSILVEVNCTLFEIEGYASCGSVINYFFYVQQALRKQSRLQAKQNASADNRHQYKGIPSSSFASYEVDTITVESLKNKFDQDHLDTTNNGSLKIMPPQRLNSHKNLVKASTTIGENVKEDCSTHRMQTRYGARPLDFAAPAGVPPSPTSSS